MFSKLQFSKFKIFVSKSVFSKLQLTQISLNFKTSSCKLKITGLGKNYMSFLSICVSFLRYLIYSRIVTVFSCEKTLNITHNRKGISNFEVYYKGTFITLRYWLWNLQLAKFKTRASFWQISWMNIVRVNLNSVFIDQSNVNVPFFKKIKSFLVIGISSKR